MKSIFVVVFLVMSTLSNAQRLDPFFQKNRECYSVKNISDYYFQLEYSTSQIDSLALYNSAILKKDNYYLYLLNEMTRAKFKVHSGKIKEALKLLETLKKDPYLIKNKTLSANYNNTTGNLYFQMGSLSKANNYYQKAIRQYRELKDSVGWIGILINTGNIYATLGNSKEAFIYYQKARHLDSLGVKEHHLGLISNLARYFASQKNNEKAIEMYEEVYGYATDHNDTYARIVSCINLGDCYLTAGKYTKAIAILEEGKRLSVNRGFDVHIVNFNRLLGMCYAEIDEYPQAYSHMASADSGQAAENKKHLEEFAERINLKHKEELHKKQQFISLQSLERKKYEQKLLIVFLIIAAFLIASILLLYIQKRKKNRILVQQNFDLVEHYRNPKTKKSNEKKISLELIERMESLFIEENLFRDPELSLDKLAKLLDTNRTYLSENVNAYYGYSFRVLLNKLRVNDARQMLVSDDYVHYSIEGIAITVGYRNLSSFNIAFKKESGITPSYFRSQKSKF